MKSQPPFGLRTGWRSIDESIGGLQTGLHVVAADSNVGKSSWTAAMVIGLFVHNPGKVAVLDLTLDDPKADRLGRVVAARANIPINVYRRPARFADRPDLVGQRDRTAQAVMKLIERGNYLIYDSTEQATDLEDITQRIAQFRMILDDRAERGEKRQMVVFLDALHDVETKELARESGDTMRIELVVQRLSQLCTQFDIPMVVTAELRKINGFRRPTLDDIRDSIKIRYEARVVWLLYNELGLRQDDARLFWVDGDDIRQPVLEVDLRKNKSESTKGRSFLKFIPDRVQFIEPTPQEVERYRQLLRRG